MKQTDSYAIIEIFELHTKGAKSKRGKIWH